MQRVDRGMRALATVLVAGLFATGCTSGDSDDVEDAATTTEASTTTAGSAETTETPATTDAPDATDAPATTESAAPETTESSGEPSGGADPCSASQAPAVGAYAVTGIPADDPDGGLVARRFPGAGEEQLDVLPEGTVVDVIDTADCAVVGGGVWYFIGTQQLPIGGWVNSRFLTPVGDGAAPGDTGEDDFDVPSAQAACVYEGDLGACDLLTTFGIGTPDDNYGLGNSYTQAPDDAIIQLCSDLDPVACGELAARGLTIGSD